MREAVSEDDVCEYAVAYDDELMRCDAREGRVGRGGTGVGGFERGVEQYGSAEVVGNGFSLELGCVVTRAG
jgi:hypothetical protein